MNTQPEIPDLPLRDIHYPDPISWWPPAPGWWIVAALSIAMCVFIARWFIKRHQRLSIYRSAEHELAQIKENYIKDTNGIKLSQELSILLRRITMTLSSRRQSAGLTGERWLLHLDELAQTDLFNSETGRLLIEAPYKPSSSIDGESLLTLCAEWITQVQKNYRGAQHA